MKLSRLTLTGRSLSWATILGLSSIVAPAAYSEESSRAIEEVIVTSRRVEESVQEVPVAVTAFTQENVKQVAPRTLRDFDGLVPNVRIGMNTAGPSAGAIYIRGIGYADIEKTQAPAVGIIIDGVFQGSNTGQLIDTFDVMQLEVNRGPQGVLQGKNTTGGTIVVTRFRPEFNEFGFAGALQTGSYGEQQLKTRFNIPLIDDTLAMKVSLISKERDGYFDNITKGCKECAGDIDYDSATVALRWEPSESFGATFTYDYIRDRGDIPPQDPTWDGDDPFENAANFDEFQEYDVDALSLNMAWEFESATLTSITSLTNADDTVGQDFDGGSRTSGASPLGTLHTLREQELEVFTQELKLDGELSSLDNLRYTVGAYYYESELDFAQGTNLIVQIPIGLPPGVPCGAAVPGWVDNPDPAIGNSLCQLPPSYANQESSEDVESFALFGALTWDLTDRIELHAGVRYIDETKDFETKFGTRAAPSGPVDPFYGDPINPPTLPGVTVFPGFPVSVSESWTETVGELKGSWRVTDSNMIYGSYSQGFRSGGFSMRGTDPNRLAFDPETIDAFEIGAKNDFFDNRLRVNLAAFYMELEDQQFSSILNIPTPPGTNTLILNAPGTTTQGIELEVTASLGEYVTLIGIYGYQDVESDDNSFSCLDRPVPPLGQACNPTANPDMFPNGQPIDIDTAGGITTFTPKHNYAFTGVYDRDIGPGRFTGSISVKATAKVAIATDQTGALFFEPSNEIWDARLAYEWSLADEKLLTVELIGKNLSDEEYREQRLFLGNGLFQGWGPPRTWSLSLSYTH